MFATDPENCTGPRNDQRHGFAAFLHGRHGTHGRLQVQGGGSLGMLGRLPSHGDGRHPPVAETMVQGLARVPALCFSAVRTCVASLTEAGLEVPSWNVLREKTAAVRADVPEPSEPKFGRQQKATRCLQKFHDEECWPGLSNPERPLMRSLCGPLASVMFTAVPTCMMTRIEVQPFPLLLLRRLRLPLSLDITHLPVWPPT